jgi:hypothetical protein
MNKWNDIDKGKPYQDGRYAVVIFNPHLPEQKPWTTFLDYKSDLDKWIGLEFCTLLYWMEVLPIPSGENVVHRPKHWSDFMLEAENHPNELVEIEGSIYKVSDDIEEFIRDYGWETYSQMNNRLKDLLDNGLLVKQK